MRPRTLRELTELAREEMSPTEEERGRVYDSLCVAVAAGTAATALVASASAASTTAASTTATSSTAAGASGAAAQGGALAAGAAQAGGSLASSGLLLKGLVLLVAVGGGAGLLTTGDGEVGAEHAQSALTEEVVPLRRATAERIEAPAEVALIVPVQELGVQEVTPPRTSDSPPRRVQTRVLPEARNTTTSTDDEALVSHVEEGESRDVDAALTRAARRLQHAQRAMARGDGASTLALLAEDVDPRLRTERLALRVLALCQIGDATGARREADELRAMDEPSSAALARISNSCAGH